MIGEAAHKESARDDGFTLVETLVALSLVALITLVAFVGLRLGSDSWSRTERRSQLAGEVAAAQRFIRRSIEQAYPGIVDRVGAPPVVAFRGSPDALELSGPVPSELSAGGRHRLYIRHSPDDELTLGWAPERNQRPVSEPAPTVTQATLLTGVRGVAFAYFGQASGEPEARWHREWVDQRALPRLVRVQARLADDAAKWPILDAAPRIDVDANCVLDLLTRACRGR